MACARRAALAWLLAFSLAFCVPTPAFAALVSGVSAQSDAASDATSNDDSSFGDAPSSLEANSEAQPAAVFESGDWRFEQRGDNIYVVRYIGAGPTVQPDSEGSSQPAVLTLPDSVDSLPVYGVAAEYEGAWNTFEHFTCDSYVLAFPSNIQAIDEGAFASCDKLVGVDLPQNSELTSIGAQAFYKTSLSSIALPSTLGTIGNQAFRSCSSLETATFADGCVLTSMGKQCFSGTALTQFRLPVLVSTVPQGAFSSCKALEKFTVGAGSLLKTIDVGAFNACSSLSSFNFETATQLDSIGNYAFDGTVLQKASFPDSLRQIGYCSFYQCPSLESIEFSSNSKLSSIGDFAFSGASIASVAVPAATRSIGYCSFYKCANLSSVTFAADARLTTIGDFAFSESLVESMAFPASLTSIGQKAFYKCPKLVAIVFEDNSGLNKLGDGAFSECRALATVVLPDALPSISTECFKGAAIRVISIPQSVRTLQSSSFSECGQLVEVQGCKGLEHIYEQVFSSASIEGFPFESCSALKFVSGKSFQDIPDYQLAEYLPDYFDFQGGDYYWSDAQLRFTGIENYELAFEALDRINEQRGTGMNSLVMDSEMMTAAMQRASELPVRFSDTRPLGSSGISISGKAIAENFAAGQTTAEDVVTSWNSNAQQRANMMDESARCVGVGCFNQNGTYYWVVLFSEQEAGSKATRTDATVVTNHAVDLVSTLYQPSFYAAVEGDVATSARVGRSMKMVVYSSSVDQTIPYASRPDVDNFLFAAWPSSVATVDRNTGDITFTSPGTVTVFGMFQPSRDSSSSQSLNYAAYTFEVADREDVANATIIGITKKQYTGKPIEQKFSVIMSGKLLAEGVDYTVAYANNTSVGNASVTITGIGDYQGTVTKRFKIVKADQPMVVTAKSKKIKFERLATGPKKVKAVTVSNAKGAVTFKNKSKQAEAKLLKVNAKTGKITVPKTDQPITYTMKVRAKAAGNSNYKKGAKTVTFTITVR